jgi:hypothetical protein
VRPEGLGTFIKITLLFGGRAVPAERPPLVVEFLVSAFADGSGVAW